MTDKQIINGVDVGWCKNYNEANSKDCETLYICAENPNCYYKQLKRKEQECERLKERLIKCDDNIIVDCEYSKKDLCSFIHRKKEVINGLQQQLDQLKGKVKRYEEILQRNVQGFETGATATAFADIVNGVVNSIKDEKLFKLKQTLTEIKDIAEKMKKLSEEDGGELTECFFRDKQCERCSDERCLPYWFEQILQKISEVEDVENN